MIKVSWAVTEGALGSRSLLVQISQEETLDLARELTHQRKAKKVGITRDWIRSGENSWPEMTTGQEFG